MDVIDMLTEQHRTIEAGLKQALTEEGDARWAKFKECADELMAHILVEEEDFYPAVKARRTEDILLESLEEHLSLKRLIADLVALDSNDEHVVPKLHVLKEQAEHHHKEEEEGLFPKVRKLLGEAEREKLGVLMNEHQRALLRTTPRKRAAAETAAARDV